MILVVYITFYYQRSSRGSHLLYLLPLNETLATTVTTGHYSAMQPCGYYVGIQEGSNNGFNILTLSIDGPGAQNRYGMLQYYFDVPEIEIHMNAKSSTPFFCTSDSARKAHKELALKSMPKNVLYQATLTLGGEIKHEGCLLCHVIDRIVESLR